MTQGGIDASGWTVSWVGGTSASNIDGMEGVERVIDADQGMELFEDLVNRTVVAPTIPPTFNHALVVSIDDEVPAS